MKKIFITILFSLISFDQAFSLDIVMMGGGGEPNGKTTIFDKNLQKFATAKDRIVANVQMSFNGGHETTTSIIDDKIKVPHTSFTKENYNKLIESSLLKITSGAIPKGGQLMVIIETHGGAKEPPHDTHSIALSGIELKDMTSVSGEGSDSIDKLKALAKAAEDKGVKLAIVDMSCHSGNSLSLANKNTCVVSSSGPNHFGYAGDNTFSNSFYDQMIPGQSLEDAFLKARSLSSDKGFPMISSPVGLKMNEKLYPLFTPYLFDHDNKADKFNPYIRQVARCENRIQRDLNFEALLSEIEKLEKISGIARSKYSGQEVLKNELIAYKKLQDQMLDELEKLHYRMLFKKDTITYSVVGKKDKTVSEDLTIEDILRYPEENLGYFKETLKDEIKKKYPKNDINDTINGINKITAVLKRKAEINALYPEINQTQSVFSKIDQLSKDITNKAGLISDLARKVYDKDYQDEQKLKKEPNPCSDFKF